MEKKIVYPVIIPTLCRYEHFKRCVESLSKCVLANKTELIIGLDYPMHKEHECGYKKIKKYINEINGFKEVIILYSGENLGISKNITRLIEYIKDKYDAYILTEDDNVFSPCFLEYMNYSLNRFKDEKTIQIVTGYSPLEFEHLTTNPVLLSKYAFMWGVGIWINKDNIGIIPYYEKICKNFRKSLKIFKEYPAALGILIEMVKKNTLYGDICYTIENVLNNRYVLMPSISLVRNIGQDGSGLHSGINNKIQTQNISLKSHYLYTQGDIERAFELIKSSKYKVKSFSLLLSSNKLKAIMQINKIIISWVLYQFHNK